MTRPTATLMVNLAARGVPRGADWERVARFLGARGVETRAALPGTPADALGEARRSAERGDRWLFVVGGDGSSRVAAAGLAGSATALAAVPLGTVNVWARETRIPRKLRAALECHLQGQPHRIDLGRSGEERFILMGSAGWDAAVARDVDPAWKRRLGDIAYVLQGARSLRSLESREMDWLADGHARPGPAALIVVSNTRLYAGYFSFTPGAMADDGLLDAIAVSPGHFGHTLGLGLRLLARRMQNAPHTEARQLREFEITSRGVPVQFDGDYIGETPITIRVEPGALAVSLPAGKLPPFLSAEETAAAQPGTVWTRSIS